MAPKTETVSIRSCWLVAIALSCLLVGSVRAQDEDRPGRPGQAPPLLTVTGTGEVRVDPDEGQVRLGVSRQTATAQEAQGAVNEAAHAIQDAVSRTGVPKEQIQTSQLTLLPIYAPQKPESTEPPTVRAYRASNVVTIRVTKLSQLGSVVDAALKAGANQIEGVSFSVKDELPARTRALREAAREAREKATAIADALGVKLLNVQDAQEGGVSIRQPMFQTAMMARAADSSTPVSPGQIQISATVTVRWRIQQK